jgi:hypothetical protein
MAVQIRIRTRIPEDRKVTLELPPETPTGDVEMNLTIDDRREARPIQITDLPPQDCARSGLVHEIDKPCAAGGRPRAFPPRPTDPKLAREHDLFEQMLPELMKAYAGKFVALHEGKVVEVGSSASRVLTNAHLKFPGTIHYVRLVTDQPLPLDRVTSHRVVRSDKQ